MPAPSSQPILTIYAGPNGSGKTTCYEDLKASDPIRTVPYVNADVIALKKAQAQGYTTVNELNDKLRYQLELAAGKEALTQRTALLSARASFTLETTASSQRTLDLIAHAHQQGYVVKVNFLYLPRVELNLARIAQRVSQGGHSVPEAVVRRRYPRALALIPALLQAADRFALIDNSVSPTIVLQKTEEAVTVQPQPELGWTKERLEALLLGVL